MLTVSETGLPFWVWLLKYIAAAAVAVTFLTVMVFLGPTLGYRSQLEGKGFYYHAAGPLLAVLSFCFLERFHTLGFSLSLLGMLPVVLYGLLYAWKVLLCPKDRRWEDFYGYTRGGHWLLSVCAMLRTIFSRREISSPSSRMKPQVRYLGTAPRMRRSLTVPQTQSLPMSPPR